MPVSRSHLRPAAGLLVSALCIALLVRVLALAGVTVEDVGISLRAGNPLVLVPAVALYFGGTLVRSVRWQHLLEGTPIRVPLLFRTLVIGLMVNDLVPARLGELARVLLLSRDAGVPIGRSLASILVERVLDGVALTAFLVLGIFLVGSQEWMVLIAQGAAAIFAVATVGIMWAAVAPDQAAGVGRVLIRVAPDRFRPPLVRLMESMLTGLGPIARPATACLVLVLSLLAWAAEGSMYVVIMAGFPVPGGLSAGLLGTAVANLATLVPSAPGYVGTFDLALQQVLVQTFGASEVGATSYTLVVHLALLVPVVLLGLFFLWRENLSLPDLGRLRHGAAQPPPVAGR